MELFGYLCSPLCRQKADLKGIHVPVFAGQKSVREARKWRKVGLIAGSAAALVVVFLGFMIWYQLFGSAPRVQFAVRFEQPAYSGASYLCGPENRQVVFLHGGKLARHDVKEKKEIWSVDLVDHKEIEREVQAELKRLHEMQAKRDMTEQDARPVHIPPPEKLAKDMARWAADELELRVVGQNIWVANSKQVVRHDWETGKPGDRLPVQGGFGGLIERGEELLRLDRQRDKDVITHINLASGKISEEQIVQPMAAKAAENRATTLAGASTGNRRTSGAGLPVGTPGRDMDKPLDARKVEQQVSRLSLPAQIALPAVLSVNRTQERTLAEMDGGRGLDPDDLDNGSGEYFTLVPAKDGYVQFSTKLIEKKMVAKQAMKARPSKSALDGPVTVTVTMDIANEILNDMQRDRGGETELVDESRFQVTVRRADGKEAAEWSGEVVGRPAVFSLTSVNVIAANQKIIVLDKSNKKLWESPLTYNVEADAREGDPKTTGQGPCVERGNTLFVFDEGVLTAFDLKTGNAKWRLPSVGISGLFFDDDGMMYVDSTTASPDAIKYSRQIDVTAKNMNLILKIDPRTGKTLWSRETGGSLSYVSGKYLYTFQGFGANDDDEEESPYTVQTGFETKNLVRIRRLNPKNGKELWEHSQDRLPLDVRFDQNRIHLVFKKEVQVLKCGTL